MNKMNTITQEEIDNLPQPPQEWIDDMKKRIDDMKNKKKQEIKRKLEELLTHFCDESNGGDECYALWFTDDFIKTTSSIKSRAKCILELKKLVRENKYKEPTGDGNGVKGKKHTDWYWLVFNTNEIYHKLNECLHEFTSATDDEDDGEYPADHESWTGKWCDGCKSYMIKGRWVGCEDCDK